MTALTSCGGKRETVKSNTLRLSGTVTYRARIALPPDAVVRVSIVGASGPDSASSPLAEQMITTNGRQVPIAFEVQVADSLLSRTARYALRAEIRGDGGVLLWTNSASYELPQPASSQENIEIVVVQNAASDGSHSPASAEENMAHDSAATGTLTGLEWQVVRMQPIGAGTVSLAPDEVYTILFDAKGRYNGQAHCNRYGGDYHLTTSGALTLMQGISTLAACAPPSSSDVFMRLLHAATSLTQSNDTLRLVSPAQGSLVFTRQGTR